MNTNMVQPNAQPRSLPALAGKRSLKTLLQYPWGKLSDIEIRKFRQTRRLASLKSEHTIPIHPGTFQMSASSAVRMKQVRKGTPERRGAGKQYGKTRDWKNSG